MRSEGTGHCRHHGHSARTLTRSDIESSKVAQALHASARIVAEGLLRTTDSLDLTGVIAQACPGVVVGSKWLITIIVIYELRGPKRKGDLRIG